MLVCLFKGYDNQVSFSDIPAGYVQAYIYFESDITEIKSEAFLVDFGNLVSSIGGSLGLFLGFSCYTSIIAVLEFIFKKQN